MLRVANKPVMLSVVAPLRVVSIDFMGSWFELGGWDSFESKFSAALWPK